MHVTISSRHTTMTESLENVTREKISRLGRIVDGLERAEVHFFEERNPRIAEKETCEVTLEGHGHHVRCKVNARDGYVAVDKAVVKLEKQLRKLKTKNVNRLHGGTKHGGATTRLPMPTPEEAREIPREEREPAIVKTKSFEMESMTPEEATLHLDLVGHNFFMFENADTGRAAVVYLRNDGDYGLIDQAG
ncbi:MAG: ribosome-associated translation inhibitor RaiA [Acidimicrobiia bacterium]|nr:ribosome-associated translation inhibitor RaiA [Acidimicrobiia bacterium]